MSQKVVLISGCSSGIGFAMVKEFSSRGYFVVATARKLKAIKNLKSSNVDIAALDVTNAKSISACVKDVIRKKGKIDILVNNAGYALVGPVVELPVDDLRKQFETNLIGVVALSKEVFPYMQHEGSGVIVNISSVSGILATPFAGAYCASKAAVNLISDSMRMELKPFGIQVITVQPGAIRSNFGNAAAKSISLNKKSVYAPISKYIEARARTSQKNPTTAEDFARILIDKLLRKNPPSVIRIGNESRKLPFMKKLPVSLTDRLMMKVFGLNKLK